MKLSYTLATPETDSPNILAFRGNMKENFKTISELGYQGIELMIRDPGMLDVGEIKSLCSEFNIEISSVSTGQLRKELGLQLCTLDEDLLHASIDKMKEVIDFTVNFNTQVNIGTLRGTMPSGKDESKGYEHVKKVLNELLDYANDKNVNLALEPQNRYTINWLNNAKETLNFIGNFRQPNLKIVFDVYHWLLEEKSIYASLVRTIPYITHVQFSDSNRLAPGWGQLNFPDIVRVLRALDYNGYISVECSQKPNSYEAAKQAITHLLPLINETEEI